jgi:hypothetical protein
MAIDYAALAGDVKQLIEDNGREVDLILHSEAPADSQKPWRGRDDSNDTTITATAILVEYEEDEIDDQLVRRGDQRCLLAATSANVAGQDIKSFDTLDDSGVTGIWHIINVNPVQPGDTLVVYDIQLRR